MASFERLVISIRVDLCTVGVRSTNLYDTLCHVIKMKALIAATRAQSVLLYPNYTPYITIISIISTIIRIISKIKIEIWMCIH